MGNDTVDASNIQPKTDSAGICGAIAQQRQADHDGGHESTPQKFLHLVGWRDLKVQREPWRAPRPPSRKP